MGGRNGGDGMMRSTGGKNAHQLISVKFYITNTIHIFVPDDGRRLLARFCKF
jgi:hypothetical protein